MTRIVIATAISTLTASIALSQNHVRTKSLSPTPTPTPKPSTQFQSQANPQWPTASPSAGTAQVPARGVQSQTATAVPRFATAQVPARSVQSIPAASSTRNAAQFPSTSAAPSNPTPAPIPPPNVNAYLQRMIANSNDQKLHLTVNGKDLALTPFHVWPQKSTGPNTTSACVDTRSSEGRVYDIDIMTTGTQVTGIKIHRINGETVKSGQ